MALLIANEQLYQMVVVGSGETIWGRKYWLLSEKNEDTNFLVETLIRSS